MLFKEINQKFTDKVVEYINKGYHINSATMSGSQGETAKVDLTDGKEIIRILIDDKTDYDDYSDYTVIIVCRCTDNVRIDFNSTWDIIWNDHCEIISEDRFYKAGNGWFVTKDESVRNRKIKHDRHEARRDSEYPYKDYKFDDSAKNIMISCIKRKLNRKRFSIDKIEGIYKQFIRNINNEITGVRYYAKFTDGKRLTIHQ